MSRMNQVVGQVGRIAPKDMVLPIGSGAFRLPPIHNVAKSISAHPDGRLLSRFLVDSGRETDKSVPENFGSSIRTFDNGWSSSTDRMLGGFYGYICTSLGCWYLCGK